MSRKRLRQEPGNTPRSDLPGTIRRGGSRLVWGFALVLVVSVIAGTIVLRPKAVLPSSIAPKPSRPDLNAVHDGPLTFNRDIAPIIFDHCAGCHHPGQAAPFSLLSYSDVRKRSKTILDVIQRRYMPPWLPEKGYGQFVGERSLTEEQIDLIQRWVAQGSRRRRDRRPSHPAPVR